MSKTAVAPTTSALGRFWHKWRFHLNILLVLIPLGYMPRYFSDAALFRGDTGLGQHVNELQAGPWSLQLAELWDEAPRRDGPAGYFKSFNASLCAACGSQVKATYLRIGKPRSLRAAGVIFFGTPYRMGAVVPIPENSGADAELWVTLEGWDGSVHQASIPLSKASPLTVAWLKKRGARP
ncbi:thiamine pyrophosphate-binding protein [Pseudomonas asplenii]|uniref:thiamine pyrophosphate-binding protein n=1 Tax=Pseudomonas asplenii TaxID=53407 RepID=UPI0022340998|nr:thiamine pyrophosphate-binding protein [Pseudomonas asplenii]UZE30889.1 thiamine pyrophosphate-binding protein [Pseudomonas asplenii]